MKYTVEFDEHDLDMLMEVYKNWNSLSSNPKDYRSMCDHCHNENDHFNCFINRMEKKVNG